MAAGRQAIRKLGGSVVTAVLCASGCTQSTVPTAPAAQMSAGIRATLTTATPPHTGDDTLLLTLSDAQTGQPIGDANVTGRAEATSPRLPGQPNSGRAQGNGVYQVPVVLAVASPYRVQVQAARPGKQTATFSFMIDVLH